MKELKDHIEEELKKINPELVELYKTDHFRKHVQLKRGETSIITIPGDKETLPYALLYEVYPKINRKGIKKLFGRSDDVTTVCSLREAVTIAEYALGAKYSPLLYQKLQELV